MGTVAHHQTQAARFLALADSNAQDGDFRRSLEALERAVAHAAAAANSHWRLFPRPNRRQLGYVLFSLARKNHLSYTSARSLRRFNQLHFAIQLDLAAGNHPAARRTLRNTRRRVARIIDSVNRAIAADPNPTPVIPEIPDFIAVKDTEPALPATTGMTGEPNDAWAA